MTIYAPNECGVEVTVNGYDFHNLRCGRLNGGDRCNGEVIWESGIYDSGSGDLICCVCNTWYYASATFTICRLNDGDDN